MTNKNIYENKYAKTTTQQNIYNYKVIKQLSIMTIIWGVVGMMVG